MIKIPLLGVFLIILSCNTNNTPEDILVKGQACFENNNYIEALQIYETILKGNTNSKPNDHQLFEAHYNKVLCLIHIDKPSDIISNVEKLINNYSEKLHDNHFRQIIEDLLENKDAKTAFGIITSYRENYPENEMFIRELEGKSFQVHKESDEYKKLMKLLEFSY